MSRKATLTLIYIFAVIAAGCSRHDAGRPTLAVSIEPQRYLLEQIVGDGFDIVTIMDDNASPESFEPSMSRRVMADKADIYFQVGLMPFEESLVGSLGNSVKIVDTSDGIELMYGTHEHCREHGHASHRHGSADPHVWSSIRNAKIMARNMLPALIELQPDSAEIYTGRLARLEQRLDSADAAFATRLAGAPRTFAIWHPSLSYFARDYGLNQLAIDRETKEISMRQRREIANQAKADSVRVLFVQRQYDTRQAMTVNEAIGARIAEINPMSYNIIEELNNVVDCLTEQ